MIAIETMRLTLATIATRLTPACPGAPRNCSSARRSGALRGIGAIASSIDVILGMSIKVPTSSSAIAT